MSNIKVWQGTRENIFISYRYTKGKRRRKFFRNGQFRILREQYLCGVHRSSSIVNSLESLQGLSWQYIKLGWGRKERVQHFGAETFNLSTVHGVGGFMFKMGLGEIDFGGGSWVELPRDRG
jgi:hypothetical protein